MCFKFFSIGTLRAPVTDGIKSKFNQAIGRQSFYLAYPDCLLLEMVALGRAAFFEPFNPKEFQMGKGQSFHSTILTSSLQRILIFSRLLFKLRKGFAANGTQVSRQNSPHLSSSGARRFIQLDFYPMKFRLICKTFHRVGNPIFEAFRNCHYQVPGRSASTANVPR